MPLLGAEVCREDRGVGRVGNPGLSGAKKWGGVFSALGVDLVRKLYLIACTHHRELAILQALQKFEIIHSPYNIHSKLIITASQGTAGIPVAPLE